ncbi:MAG: VIT1/CCC1 transporter family protein [Nanoarchaeota archaeon]
MVDNSKIKDGEKFKTLNHVGYTLKDIILGGQDGLVNVLGIVLAVAGATNENRIILISGLAATFAESLSMGAVALTSSKAANDFYKRELLREKQEIETIPDEEKKEVKIIYQRKGFSGKLLSDIVKKITSSKKIWLETMMQEELRLFPDEYKNPWRNAMIVGFSSLVGSLIPLIPFLLMSTKDGMISSVVLSSVVLFGIGAVKSKLTIGHWLKSGFEMVLIGLVAAGGGYLIGLALGALPAL